MTSIKYKGYSILARPYQLSDSKRWTVDLEIRRHGGRKPFSLDERYRTEKEADARCSGLGREIIDGKVPGWSVDGLRTYRRESMIYLILAGLVVLGFGGFVLLRDATASITSWPVELWVSEFSITPGARESMLGGVAVVAGMALIAAGMRRRA